MLPGFNRMARITRKELPDLPAFSLPHYFPLSMLGDDFWDNVNADNPLAPIIRVTDSFMNEVPVHVVGFNAGTKTGALWFRATVQETPQAYFIHWETETEEAYSENDPYGSKAVWSSFLNVHLLNEDPANVIFFNSVNGETGVYSGSPTGNYVAGPLEYKANEFKDSANNLVSFAANTYNKFTTPVTFLFWFNMDKLTGDRHLFGNWRHNFVGQQPYRVLFRDGELGVELGQSGLGWWNAAPVDVVVDTWYMAAIKYNAGPGGVEIDLDGVAQVLGDDEGLWPADSNSAARTIGGVSTNGSDARLSTILMFNGALSKIQRDVFFDNWTAPVTFWTLNNLEGPPICLHSEIDTEVCLVSQLVK